MHVASISFNTAISKNVVLQKHKTIDSKRAKDDGFYANRVFVRPKTQ